MKLLLLLATATITVVGISGPELKSSSPGKDTIIEDPPLKVILTFTDKVRADSSAIAIMYRDTTEFFKLEPKATDKPEVIEAVVPRKLLGGHYLVRWKTMGSDGKFVTGLYPFVVDFPE